MAAAEVYDVPSHPLRASTTVRPTAKGVQSEKQSVNGCKPYTVIAVVVFKNIMIYFPIIRHQIYCLWYVEKTYSFNSRNQNKETNVNQQVFAIMTT